LTEATLVLVSLGVSTALLTRNNVDEATVVLPALLSTSSQSFFLVFLLRDLWGLTLDFTGTSQRTVDFTTTKTERQMKSVFSANFERKQQNEIVSCFVCTFKDLICQLLEMENDKMTKCRKNEMTVIVQQIELA
jgi:hypothetical protein